MAIDPPYRLDPFRNIVGISWHEIGTGGTGGPGGVTIYVPIRITLQWFGESGSVVAYAPDNGHRTNGVFRFPGTLTGSPGTQAHYGHYNGFNVSAGISASYAPLLDGIVVEGPFTLDCSAMVYTADGPPADVYVATGITSATFYDSGLINPSYKEWRWNLIMELQ